jgi:hypothetical protein
VALGYNIIKYFISDNNIVYCELKQWRQQGNENKVIASIHQKMEHNVERLYSTGQTSFAETILIFVME